MNHIKSYQLFESSKKQEMVEDCFLELTDTPYNWKLEEFKPGVIKFAGEIIGDSLSMTCDGKYTSKEQTFSKLNYEIKAYERNWNIIEDDTSEGLYPTKKRKFSNNRSYKVTKEILGMLESSLAKLTRFVDGMKGDIKFTINIYQVERGTCLVVYIQY